MEDKMFFADETTPTAELEPRPVWSAVKILSCIALLIAIFAIITLAAGNALKARGLM